MLNVSSFSSPRSPSFISHSHFNSMTTRTTVTLSPIKRCATSPHLRKRRWSSNRKHQTCLTLPLPATITVTYRRHHSADTPLPDLVNDVLIEHQRRETIVRIATLLRKVGDQMDERLQVIRSNCLRVINASVTLLLDQSPFADIGSSR